MNMMDKFLNCNNRAMVTLTKQHVPSYLVGSDFYNSLSADAEDEFTIPNEYFKSTTSVSNAEELSNLLRTANFWGLKKLPNEIIEKLVFKSTVFSETERVKICKVLLEFDVEFDLLELYLTIPVSSTRKQRFNVAVQCGREDLLDYVYSVDGQVHPTLLKAAAVNGHYRLIQRILHEQNNEPQLCSLVPLNAVAGRGHLDCLRYLLDTCFLVDPTTGIAAAKNGHLPCLQLAHERGYVIDRNTVNAAASEGHLDCLVYILQHGGVATAEAASAAAVGGHAECLEYLLDQGVPLTKALCNAAASGGSLACLRLLRARGCPWDKVCPKIAARQGHLSCLKYIVNQGGAADKAAAHVAAENGKHFCLAYLLERGCVLGKETVDAAAKRGHLRCLHILKRFEVPLDEKYVLTAIQLSNPSSPGYPYLRALVRAGYAMPSTAVKYAIDCNALRCLECLCAYHCCELTTHHAAHAASKPNAEVLLEVLHQYDCPWDVHTCINAASAVTDSVLAFAHTHGCPWDERVCSQAIQCGRLKCLMYACENGCPCSAIACAEAAQWGRCDMLQFLHEHGCPLTLEACIAAANYNHTDCLRYLITHGCSWDAAISTAAARAGSESTLAYAVWHGGPCDIETSIAAGAAGSQSCLQLLHQHGCLWDEKVSEAAAMSGDAAALRYCVEHGCPMTKVTMEKYNKNRLNISSEDRFKSHHYWEPDVEKSW